MLFLRSPLTCAVIALSAACGSSAPTTLRDSVAITPPAGTIPAGPYVPGQAYVGRNGYIEYVAGNGPVIFTAPHGGALLPAEIPDRVAASCGGDATTTTDLNTIELARAMQQRYFARFGRYPHIIINNLARRKLDPNRTIEEAACNDTEAKIAYGEWHAFIDAAKKTALAASGKAWYMDMHGHGHTIQRLELGYLLSSTQLNGTDASLNAIRALRDTASIRSIAEQSALTFAVLLRGSSSLGTLYTQNGFPSVPSASDPSPGNDSYFSGGDNTRRHACGAEATLFGGTTAGMVCGVQIEANFTGVRDNAANRDRFGDITAIVLEQYLLTHWGLRLQ